ncbi:NADH:ubiquinone reductase (Na(+)-transporting) subunit F [uncultured Haemophilus sp.]|uniref:NADH:ubiquinone reductase (Na(+)-transporting) subunit F n=1 Tax=uncultured Haemophilus sp. TaxID=237779 RepID=UPI0025CD33B1|nr:NADH:ubiquinone reductase (Na(+)-transporting) subunit F [uncultured Haemophilus sp.]
MKEDEAAENGDTVVIDFEGFLGEETFEGGKGENYSLELGSNSFIPGFEDQLVGVKAGESKEVNVTFPEDYQAEDLAGKDAVFKVTVHEVKAKELPELDDEFAKDVDDSVETLAELKEKYRKELAAAKEEAYNDAVEAAAIDLAVENAEIVELPEEIFGVKKWECTVISNDNKATFIKELKLAIPEGEEVPFRAGGYIQIEADPHTVYYKDFDIPEEYHEDWDKYDLWRYVSKVDEHIIRAYSMASYPEEKGIIMLNVRIATPPPRQPDAPPGQMSSYIWSLKPGDKVTISGPFGEFFAKETDNEMVFIGGGAGMAPMRSHIFDQLKRLHSKRKMSFWYGARSKREMFYVEDFDQLQAENPNFTWHVALSDPLPEDNWTGYTGFIHNVLYENYLKNHEAPEDCEYYMCGPPVMNAAVIKMLKDLGVEDENILLDDFGG